MKADLRLSLDKSLPEWDICIAAVNTGRSTAYRAAGS